MMPVRKVQKPTLPADQPIYRLRSQGLTPRNLCLLAPLVLAYTWAPKGGGLGPFEWFTWIMCGLMLAIGVSGLAFILTPVELVADDSGLRWRQLGLRKQLAWSDVESIGIAVQKGLDGWDQPIALILTAGRSGAVRGPPKIGINLRNKSANPATQAYRRGFTGYELNLTNAFWPHTHDIVAELQRRLENSRQSDRLVSAIHPPPKL